MTDTTLRPFVKWLGGKRKLAPFITDKFRTYGRYYEPFAGGAAVFLNEMPERATISDVNEELILAYDLIRSGGDEYVAMKEKLVELASNHSEEYYYYVRSWDRDPEYVDREDWERVSRFFYLNKAGFNGVHRLNKAGYFNVPSGKKKPSEITFDTDNYDALHDYFSGNDILFACQGYEEIRPTFGDLVYLDPPYHKTFTHYHDGDFTPKHQEELYLRASWWVKNGVQVVLSNNHTDFIIDLWMSEDLFEPYDPVVGRSVGAGYQADKKAREILMVSNVVS